MNFAAHIVQSTGLVQFVNLTHKQNYYVDGEIKDGYLVKIVSEMEEAENKYWDGQQFLELPEKPGEYFEWAGSEWVLNLTAAEEWMRLERNHRLGRSDWTQFNDSPLTDEQKAAWVAYRQELRDFPNGLTITRVEDLAWPVEP